MGLDLIMGPMMSGKTKELVRRLVQTADSKLPVAYVNNARDTRTTGDFSSHDDDFTIPSTVKTYKVKRLDDFDPREFALVGVDEGNMYDDLVETVRKWVLEYRISVVVAGLSGSFFLTPFGKLFDLIPLASDIQKLHTVCHLCVINKHRDVKLARADFSALRDRSHLAKLGEGGILVGGKDEYIPVCLECYIELNPA